MDATFQVPPGTNELIGQHLVTSAEIARRKGVTRAAVANWLTRHPAFAALAIPLSTDNDHLRSYVFWWPQVEECLAELGVPSEAAKRRGRKPPAADAEVASQAPMTIAEVLRRAADLVETRIAVTAAGGIRLALSLDDQGDYQAGQKLNTGLYEQARTALVERLPYPAGRNPERLLRSWSNATGPADMVREMRAAADASERNPR